MTFPGFTVPDGAWLPPELVYLLPHLSGVQLKVIIIALYHIMQIGGAEPLCLSDFVRLTGLSRRAIVDTIKTLDGSSSGSLTIFDRQRIGQTYAYFPRLLNGRRFSGTTSGTACQPALPGSSQLPGSGDREITSADMEKSALVQNPASANFAYLEPEMEKSASVLPQNLCKNCIPPPIVKLRESESLLILTDCLTDSSAASAKSALLAEMRSAGVYLKTAAELVERFDPVIIRRHLDHYRHALALGIAEGPGWLVLSLKESWGPPLGYITPTDNVGADPCVRPDVHPEPSDDAEANDNSPEYVPPEYHPSLLQPFPGTQHTPLTAWQGAKSRIGEESPKFFDYLQKRTVPASFNAGKLLITVTDDLTARLLADRTQSLLERTLAGLSLGAVESIRFIVEEEGEKETP